MPDDLPSELADRTLPIPDVSAASAGPVPQTLTGHPDSVTLRGDAPSGRPAPPGYQIERELGRGGMGVVYEAVQSRLKRRVALKMVLAGGHASAAELSRFLAEAEAVARLQHPNVVQLYDAGQCDGLPYFSLEFVAGGTLSARLAGTPLPPRAAAGLIEQLARGLDHAHQRGIIHRDLKPSNVLLAEDGTPKIADFGLAKWLASADRTAEALTQTGAVVGTPSYMAPEQAAGHSKEVGPTADVYALGAILYECLTGRPPFKGPTPLDTLGQVLRDEPVPPSRLQPHVPRDLETVCLKCLRKDPAKRYPDAAELAEDLRRFGAGEPVRARPVSAWERARRWVRRRPALAALLLVSALALAALLAGGLWYQGRLETALADVKDERDRVKTAEAVAVKERDAVRTAQAATTRGLYRALVGEARALRLARTEGFREQAWDALARAAKLHTPERDPDQLRHEAVGCLGDFVGLRPRELTGFPATPMKVALHPNAALAAVALADRRIALHELPGGQRVALLEGHSAQVSVLAFRPDGALVSADGGGNVLTWRPGEAGRWQPTRQPGPAYSWAITLDGKYLAGTVRGTTVVWDTEQGRQVGSAPGALRPMSLSADGKLLAAAAGGGGGLEVAVWDVAAGRVLHRTRSPFTVMQDLDLSADGTVLACAGNEGLQLFDADGLKQRWLLQSEAVVQTAFSPDGQFLTLTTASNRVVRYAVASGREVAAVSHPDPKRTTDLAIGGDGRLLATVAAESVRVWDLDGTGERRVLAGHRAGVSNVAFSPDGKLVASVSKDRRAILWDPVTGRPVRTLPPFPASADCVAFSPDGRLVVVGGRKAALRVVDANTGETVLNPSHPFAMVIGVAFSPDGEYLAASGNGLQLWRVKRSDRAADGAPQIALAPVLRRNTDWCTRICFSPDSKLLAWVEGNFTARVLEVGSGADLPFRGRLLLGYHNLAFFPDGRHLGFISDKGEAEVWDVRDGKRAYVLDSPRRILSYHIAISPDGRWFVGHVTPQELGVWDTATRKLLFALPPERSPVWSIGWSADGHRLAVGLSDGGVAVWDLRRMNELVRPLGLGWTD